MAKKFVGAPVLGQFHGGASEVAVILLQLGFEAAEKSKLIGGGACETCENLVVLKAANFFGRVLDKGLAERNLSVAGEYKAAATADGQKRGGKGQFVRWQEPKSFL